MAGFRTHITVSGALGVVYGAAAVQPLGHPTETAILAAHAADIADRVPDGAILVEFGSGSSRKTELLLAEMLDLAAYVPIDVSDSALAGAKERLEARFPALHVHPILGSFND